jgi:integrase
VRGSIRKRSKRSWEICVDIGRDPSTGKRLRHFENIKGLKSEAEKRLHELLNNLEKGRFAMPKRITLGQWLNDWLSGYVKTSCSPRTSDGYLHIITRHLTPNLGMIPLSQLRPQQIQQYYSHALSEPTADGKPLSARTVLHIHRVLFQALNHGVRQGLLNTNPASLVNPPRAKKPEMKTLSPEELARLLSIAEDIPYYPIIYTAAKTGLRQAELLGLRWRNPDLDLASLSVAQVLYKRRGICQFKEPKSPHSRRRLGLLPSLVLFLKQYKAEQTKKCLMIGKPSIEDELVFCNIDGTPIDPGTLTHSFARVARKAGLAGTRFHDLRHTFASLMLMAGVHPKYSK